MDIIEVINAAGVSADGRSLVKATRSELSSLQPLRNILVK
jgi:hypothetical protein